MQGLALFRRGAPVFAMARYNVQYVQNFTDIDDKILNRATSGSSMEAVAERFIQAYLKTWHG